MRTITLLGDNIIVRGIIKKSLIKLSNDSKDKATIERMEVFKVGPDAKIEEGVEIRINPRVLTETERVIDPYDKKGQVKLEEEFFIVCKPEEIIGIFK
jgi:hypothetical protein